MAKAERRVYPRFSEDDYERIRYWAKKQGISEAEFVREATLEHLAHVNGDWDIPAFYAQRINQLTNLIAELVATNRIMNDSISSGFNALFSLTRGDNYLYDEDVDA